MSNWCNAIGHRLGARVRNKQRIFRTEILHENTPSAMALPGGFIFLTTALLDFCERQPDELAFVIGHEMGHIIRGHALQRMITRIGSEGLSAILSRGLLNPLVRRRPALKWLERAHSREEELEADEFGGPRPLRRPVISPGPPSRCLGGSQALRKDPQSLGHYFLEPSARRRENCEH